MSDRTVYTAAFDGGEGRRVVALSAPLAARRLVRDRVDDPPAGEAAAEQVRVVVRPVVAERGGGTYDVRVWREGGTVLTAHDAVE